MMVARGQAWVEGGDQAASVVHAIKHVLPDPPAAAVLSITGVPDAVLPQVAPGNSGAWVFHNGVSLHVNHLLSCPTSSIRQAPTHGTHGPSHGSWPPWNETIRPNSEER